jgi:hypothetical protein
MPSATLRAGWGWYVGFGLFGVIVLATSISASKVTSTIWPPTLLVELCLIGILFWFKTTTLKVDGNMIHYRSLFGKADIPIRNIISARVMVGFSGYDPYVRLVVRAREKDRERKHTLNLTLFTRDDIYKWLDVFRKHYPALEA